MLPHFQQFVEKNLGRLIENNLRTINIFAVDLIAPFVSFGQNHLDDAIGIFCILITLLAIYFLFYWE